MALYIETKIINNWFAWEKNIIENMIQKTVILQMANNQH